MQGERLRARSWVRTRLRTASRLWLLVRWAWRAKPREVVIGLLLVVADATALTVVPVLLGILSARLLVIAPGGSGSLVPIAVLLASLVLLPPLTSPWRNAVAANLGDRLDTALQTATVADALRRKDVAWLAREDTREAFSRLDGTGLRRITAGQAISGVLSVSAALGAGAGAAVVLAVFAPLPAVLLLASWLVARRFLAAEMAGMVQLEVGKAKALTRADYLYGEAYRGGSVKEIRLLSLAAWWVDQFAAGWLRAMAGVWNQRRSGTWTAVALLGILASTHAYAVESVIGAAISGRLSVVATIISLQAVLGMARLGELGPGDLRARYGLQALPDFVQPDAPRSAAAVGAGGRPSTSGPANIDVHGLRFTYPPSGPPVLRELDLTVPAGAMVAIVGTNGAGKTTLVKLLLGLYQPQSGVITVDGQPLTHNQIDHWQRRVAVASQSPLRLPASLRYNLTLGEPVPHDPMWTALEAFGLTQLVQRLPEGIDTEVDPAGRSLSGGEWQRVGLARAVLRLRAGAGLLVLDEPTSQLDARAEAQFNNTIGQLRDGVTTILISHRFSTVRSADRIAVIDGGRVTEFGSHDELMTSAGRYREMYTVQAEAYGVTVDGTP